MSRTGYNTNVMHLARRHSSQAIVHEGACGGRSAHQHGLNPFTSSLFTARDAPEVVGSRGPVAFGGAGTQSADRSLVDFGQLDYSPENVLGSYCGDADAVLCDRSRLLPAVRGLPYDPAVIQPDYNTVGTVAQSRACIQRMFTEGLTDIQNRPLVNAGANFNVVVTDLNISLGFVLQWGVSMLAYAPFPIQIRTVGWETQYTQDVDREFTIFADGRAGGGQVFVPWASRVTGMTQAMAQLGMPEDDGEGGREATISVLNVPAAIIPNFSASVQLMTAFTPYAAAYAQAQGLFVPGLKV